MTQSGKWWVLVNEWCLIQQLVVAHVRTVYLGEETPAQNIDFLE